MCSFHNLNLMRQRKFWFQYTFWVNRGTNWSAFGHFHIYLPLPGPWLLQGQSQVDELHGWRQWSRLPQPVWKALLHIPCKKMLMQNPQIYLKDRLKINWVTFLLPSSAVSTPFTRIGNLVIVWSHWTSYTHSMRYQLIAESSHKDTPPAFTLHLCHLKFSVNAKDNGTVLFTKGTANSKQLCRLI